MVVVCHQPITVKKHVRNLYRTTTTTTVDPLTKTACVKNFDLSSESMSRFSTKLLEHITKITYWMGETCITMMSIMLKLKYV